jgi:hypothetical protein
LIHMSLSDFNYEEELALENAKDWLVAETVYNHIRDSMRMSRDMVRLGIAPSRRPVRLYPDDGIACVLDPQIFIRVAEHVGYGFRIICRKKSDDLFFDGQPCPICSSLFADGAMYLQFRWLMPCRIHAATSDNGWRWFKNAAFAGMQWLELDDALRRKLLRCSFLSSGLRLERTSDWSWTLKRESHVQPFSPSDLRRLRRDLRPPGLLLPKEETVVDAVKVAEANWHHSPEPGRTSKVLGWLPPGAVLVPCHFASKKPRVYWKALWTAQEFAAYGSDRADKGNIAVKMGIADIRTTDWDTDEMFREFLHINAWARDAQQSIGARGGNVWFRMKLPPSQDHCWALERDGNNGKPEKIGEFRAGNCLTTISGAHPSGVLYHVKNPGCLPLVLAEDIILPDGVRLHQQPVRRTTDYDDTPGEIRIDLSKIEGLREHPRHPGSYEGRCPVCARNGKDQKAEHLEIWPSGAFNCIADCDSTEIFALVGRRRGWHSNSENGTARGRRHGRFISKPVKYDISQSHNR